MILNRLNTSYHPSTEDWACNTWNAPVLSKSNMDVPMVAHFVKIDQANQFLDLKQASMWFWIVLTHPIILVPKIECATPEMRLCWAKTTWTCHGGAFRENWPGESVFGSKTREHVILNGLDIHFHHGNKDWTCGSAIRPCMSQSNKILYSWHIFLNHSP